MPPKRFVFTLTPGSPGGEAILFIAEKEDGFINQEIHMNCYGQLATIQTTDTLSSDVFFKLAGELKKWEDSND
jgi:hypothetical protein